MTGNTADLVNGVSCHLNVSLKKFSNKLYKYRK